MAFHNHGFRLCALLVLLPTLAYGQTKSRLFEFRPDAFFGEETEEERRELQKIQISVGDERQFGTNAVKAFQTQLKQQNLKVLQRGPDVDYLRCLVNQIKPLMKNERRYPKIRILLVDNEDTDARSFPGGTIVVYRGLIDFCESEAALFGILGHELSHADRGHQLYYLRRFKQMQQAFRPGRFDPRKMMNMGGTMAKTFARPYRPEEESEADMDGATWAFQLGYDPDEMAKVFLRLHQRDRTKAKPIPSNKRKGARSQIEKLGNLFGSPSWPEG